MLHLLLFLLSTFSLSLSVSPSLSPSLLSGPGPGPLLDVSAASRRAPSIFFFCLFRSARTSFPGVWSSASISASAGMTSLSGCGCSPSEVGAVLYFHLLAVWAKWRQPGVACLGTLGNNAACLLGCFLDQPLPDAFMHPKLTVFFFFSSVSNRRPGTETTMTRRPRAREGRRDRPAADTRHTAATTAANRVRGPPFPPNHPTTHHHPPPPPEESSEIAAALRFSLREREGGRGQRW